ncbi:hypothetical protein EMCG_02657 [[Emmonsia] crescens]|uniref:Uncharacterized protein n=1 Tax=[Emmonsia] crescens TaxID=73230 RepID=A0A0G2HXE5_9EURO|nr:hypothetical protein EMCG_02657 [Emmonsia crescens UAMH 3008]
MKLSFVGIVALLATATAATPIAEPAANVAAADWNCYGINGGGGLANLKKVHAGFNKVFGDARLKMARGQCYMAKCHGYYFGVCNAATVTKTETSGHRNVAKNANPESGNVCTIIPGDKDLAYYYGSYIMRGRITDIRYC